MDGKEEFAREEEGSMRPPQYFADGGEKVRSPMGGGKRGPSMENGGADLNYTDDELDSYSAIWEGSKTNTGKQDYRKVVTALKNISGGTELEEYLDVDNVLKYMAVHTFSVNMDSLSGNMAHNYYLYEYDGKLNILPWDYNLAFGGMGVQNASEMVNKAVDTPFHSRPPWETSLFRRRPQSIATDAWNPLLHGQTLPSHPWPVPAFPASPTYFPAVPAYPPAGFGGILFLQYRNQR